MRVKTKIIKDNQENFTFVESACDFFKLSQIVVNDDKKSVEVILTQPKFCSSLYHCFFVASLNILVSLIIKSVQEEIKLQRKQTQKQSNFLYKTIKKMLKDEKFKKLFLALVKYDILEEERSQFEKLVNKNYLVKLLKNEKN